MADVAESEQVGFEGDCEGKKEDGVLSARFQAGVKYSADLDGGA
jgi:hypothetical protein